MLARLVLNSWPHDPPTSASQNAGITILGYRARPEIILILTVEVVTQAYMFIKTHQIVYFKWKHFTVCKLYLNKVDFLKKQNNNNKNTDNLTAIASFVHHF